MADLDVRTATTQIETALLHTIANALQVRITVANNTALAALASSSRPTGEAGGERAYVTATGRVWYWDRYSTAVASSSVIVPTDAPTAGRWIRTSSTSSTGYLKSVRLYDGEPSTDKLHAWLFGQVPAVIVEWSGDDYKPRSTSPGALYWYEARFALWCISRNLRGEKQGVIGSAISAEATADPGANRIVGDLRRYLAGSTLGQTGIDYTEIVSADRVMSSLDEREHVYRLDIKVRATIHNTVADDADNPATDLERIDATWQWANFTNLDGAEYPDDYLADGCDVTIGDTSPIAISEGTFYRGGVETTVAAASIAVTSDRDVYLYVDDGDAYAVDEVTPGAQPDATPDGWLLVGVIRVSSAVDSFDRLCPYLLDSGLTDQIDTTE